MTNFSKKGSAAIQNSFISIDRVKGISHKHIESITCSVCKNLIQHPVGLTQDKICCLKCFPRNNGSLPNLRTVYVILANNLLNEVLISCQFKEFGCWAELRFDKLEDHEKIVNIKL